MTSLINDILMISRLETKEAEMVCQLSLIHIWSMWLSPR